MPMDHERSAFESRLPEDPAYWSALADRITSSAGPVFTDLPTRRAWWSPLDRFGPVVSVGAIAAAAALFVFFTGTPATPPAPAGGPETGAVPTDMVENAFRMPATPDLVTLMVLGNEE